LGLVKVGIIASLRNVEILGGVEFAPLLMDVGRITYWIMKKLGMIL